MTTRGSQVDISIPVQCASSKGKANALSSDSDVQAQLPVATGSQHERANNVEDQTTISNAASQVTDGGVSVVCCLVATSFFLTYFQDPLRIVPFQP